jgi:hypothetical protein
MGCGLGIEPYQSLLKEILESRDNCSSVTYTESACYSLSCDNLTTVASLSCY